MNWLARLQGTHPLICTSMRTQGCLARRAFSDSSVASARMECLDAAPQFAEAANASDLLFGGEAPTTRMDEMGEKAIEAGQGDPQGRHEERDENDESDSHALCT